MKEWCSEMVLLLRQARCFLANPPFSLTADQVCWVMENYMDGNSVYSESFLVPLTGNPLLILVDFEDH